MTKLNTVEPGLSKHSIVTLTSGVHYASQNGIVLVNYSGASIVSSKFLTKDNWRNYSPTTLWATQYEDQYLGFYTPDDGLIISPSEPTYLFTELDKFNDVDYIQTDPFTGEVFLIRNNQVELWDAPNAERVPYQWRSKEFVFAYKG